jgi:tetratricopeptide (TPR) repeat protein
MQLTLNKMEKGYIDALQANSRVDRPGENSIDISIKIGEVYIEKEDYDKGISYLNKALGIAKRLKKRLEQARCYQKIGDIYLRKGDLRKSEFSLRRSLRISKKIGEKLLAKASYKELAELYARWGKDKKSQKYFRLCSSTEE